MVYSTFYHLPEEKRNRILRAAVAEFIAVPYEKTSINRILEEAKVPKGSFYQYFDNKDDLYMVCIKNTYRQAVQLQLDMGVGILEGGYERIGKNMANFQEFYVNFQRELREMLGDQRYLLLAQIQDLPPTLRNTVLLEISTEVLMPQIKNELLQKYPLDEQAANFYAYLLSTSEMLTYDYGTRQSLGLRQMNYLNYRYMDAIMQDIQKQVRENTEHENYGHSI